MSQFATWLSAMPMHAIRARVPSPRAKPPAASGLGWSALSRTAQSYVAAVIVAGSAGLVLSVPLTYPRPGLFAVLLLAACLTSVWKVNLPIPLASGSTLSVSYAADLMALLLLGPREAVIISVAGAALQCTVHVKQSYPLYRTAFSTAAEAITMIATGAVYGALGGSQAPIDVATLPIPLAAAIAVYFLVNTGLVAGAIGLSTGRAVTKVWRDDFLWSGASFMVAGGAGAIAAVVVDRGDPWKAVLMLAPVLLAYWTYQMFVARLEDQKRHEEHLAAALADMTRLKELRNRLLEREQRARSSAEQANRLKDQFLAIVSHELRTPLNAMLGWSEMLREGILDGKRSDRAARAIHDSAKRQSQLIDELLDVSRIISGKLRLDRSVVDWHEIARSALEVAQPAFEAKRIAVAVHVDSSIGAFYGDPARLQQIVWNLLNNAVKFTPEGGSVHLRVRRAPDVVELSVADTGQGISRAFLPLVFEPFRQADASSTRRHGGLGLGLSIVKHLVEAHGGTIDAESAGEGCGSTFTVRLPLVPVHAADSRSTDDDDAKAAALLPQPSALLKGISVLVVDDDDGSREVVAAYLEERGATILTATSTAEALDLLRSEHVDVLLADIAMPGQDGYELIRTLRAMETPAACIPAAAVTAFARAEDRRRALDAGFQLHLTKPIGLQTLVEAVSTLSRLKP